jgi:transposase
LAWLLDKSKKEKEEYVIRLYKENKSIKEIAKIMHMSFRDIGQIINKYKKQIEHENGHVEEEEPLSFRQQQLHV